MNLFETIGTMLAGIGIFFSGVKIVGNSLKNMTSHKFRILVSKWTGNVFLGAIWGFFSGAISQSSSNTAFILISLANSGLVKVRNALPIVAWSNVGTTLLIFLVAINMNLAILILLGLSGILYGFDKGSRREHLFKTLFGISLLLFGFQMLKSGSQPFAELDFINTLFSFTSNSFIYPILLGAFLRFLIHSSSTVTILIMTISHAGLIGPAQVFLMIFGMGFGEGLVVYLLSSGMKGTARQISLFKVYEAYIASIIMILLFFFEYTTNFPLLFNLISIISQSIEQQAAYSFFAVKFVPVVIMSFFYGVIYKKLVDISPPLTEENLSQLQFIDEHSLRDVETALTLVESEQLRIIKRFPMYLENIMDDVKHDDLIDLNILHKSTLPLLEELDNFLKNVINLNLSHQTSERFINIQNRQNHIRTIELSIFNLTDTIRMTNIQGSVEKLLDNLVQSLHANLSLVVDAAKSLDELDLVIVLNATNDRGELMERIRKQYLSLDSDIQTEDKPLLLYITDLFQRIIWLSNKWASLQKSAVSN